MKNLFVKRAPIFLMLAAICTVDCASTVPDNLPAACKPDRLEGGFLQVLISSCDLDWAGNDGGDPVVQNITSSTFWTAAIAANKLKATGRVKGSGFNVTETTEDTDTCLAAEISGIEWDVTVKDFNIDLTTNLDWTFWNTMLRKGRSEFQCTFRDNSGNIYTNADGSWFNFTLSNKPTMPDNCRQYFYRELTFKWLSLDEPKRIFIPFLDTLFPI